MKKMIFICLFLSWLANLYGEERDSAETFFSLLPDEFKGLYSEKKINRKPDHLSSSGEKLYERDGLKYALLIKEKNGTIIGIHFTCTKSSNCLTLGDFKPFISSKDLQVSNGKNEYPGHFLDAYFPVEKIKLRFKNNSKLELKEIIYDQEKPLVKK